MSRTNAGIAQSSISFGENFLQDHVHSLLRQPDVAIVELIANAYDAGATRVEIRWPEGDEQEFVIEDNGTGMSRDELSRRWRTLCYNRTKEQGSSVVFPPGVKASNRIAFGQSGKGRHAMFCFASKYEIETWKNGVATKALVTRTDNGLMPFNLTFLETKQKEGHGTRVSAQINDIHLAVPSIRESVGTKFLVDPSFTISINGEELQLLDLRNIVSNEVEVPGCGVVTVRFVESPNRNRTMQLRGITWWVIGRMVGSPSWDGLDGHGSILDGRTTEARKFSFIVEADILKEAVNSDWSGFKQDIHHVESVKKAVRDHVVSKLTNVLVSSMVEKKTRAVRQNADILRPLPKVSRATVGHFIDVVQEQCHRITADDLSNLVRIVANMELSRSGYDLLRQLASCSPDDLDRWSAIMQQWDAARAEIVLGELGRRIEMIVQLETKALDPGVKELLELQPLFESNLWVFGPEYECVDFTSNRQMITVMRNLFNVEVDEISQRRPDFVILPDSTIGAYSAPDYEGGEVSGVRKVLIVELKRGGFTLRQNEMIQGLNYAKEIRKKAGIPNDKDIIVYVLGAFVEPDMDQYIEAGNIKVFPKIFSTVLEMAHARTFRLLQKIRETVDIEDTKTDGLLEDILREPDLLNCKDDSILSN